MALEEQNLEDLPENLYVGNRKSSKLETFK